MTAKSAKREPGLRDDWRAEQEYQARLSAMRLYNLFYVWAHWNDMPHAPMRAHAETKPEKDA